MSTPVRHRKTVREAVYLVHVRVKVMKDGDPNTNIIAAKLRRKDAEEVVRQVPGSWIEKVIASRP